ncbi:MAG: TonB-dependent receptor [Bacteroidales bacterium]|nr:TonB-dependent receptor [Bacteroidales bacterium]
MFSTIFLSAGLLFSGLLSGSHEPASDTLHAVSVTADKGVVVSRIDTLSVTNSFTSSDVLLQSTGLHVGDNGGAAGLKTVSLRGFGSAHTAIYLDGVRIGNVQSGQNDLGMIPMDNVGPVTVDYAQNIVSFNTLRPKFTDRSVMGRVRLSGGSFGTWLPSARLDFRLSEQMSLSANVSGVFSEGGFGYGDGLVRQNNDVSQVRAGVDLFGLMHKGDYHAKIYYNDTDRGTPGSVDWPSDDRQKDRNILLQGIMRKSFSQLYTLRLSGKASYDDIFYSSAWGDSRYGQTEIQLNSAHDFELAHWCRLSLAADVTWDALASTNYDAERLTAFSALASSFRAGRFSADIAVEYSGAYDIGALSRHAFSPSASFRLNLTDGLDLVAFARRGYRAPVFNELYYVGYGNPDLKPEDALLTDIGADYRLTTCDGWTFKAKADAFYNHLKDKITSAPTEADPNVWAPYNIGRVRSAGLDLSAGFLHSGEWNYSLDARYSLLSAVDLTPGSYSYGSQIPYVARHVAVLTGNVERKGWSLASVWHMRAGRTDGTGYLPDWNTLDLTFAKSVKIRTVGVVTLDFSVRNLFDERYETVSGYPMPGRSFIGTVNFEF